MCYILYEGISIFLCLLIIHVVKHPITSVSRVKCIYILTIKKVRKFFKLAIFMFIYTFGYSV